MSDDDHLKPDENSHEETEPMSSVLHYGGDGFDRLWSQGTNVVELWRHESPCGHYELTYRVCDSGVIPWPEVGMCEIVRRSDRVTVARLMRDHYTEPQYVWLSRDKGPVLVWASTYLYGYEVVDLGEHTLRHVAESDGEDFIWTGVCLSPDQRLLAIEGCYWACPYQIRILDVGEPTIRLPFREVGAFQRKHGALQWTDELSLQTIEDGRITWRGILATQECETGNRLPAWQALISSVAEADLVHEFLSPKEFTRQFPQAASRHEQSVLIEVMATTADEALQRYRAKFGSG